MTASIHLLLTLAYEKQATDLHIIPNKEPKARIRGEIQSLCPTSVSNDEIERFVGEHVPRFSENLGSNEIDFSIECREPISFRTRVHLYRAFGQWRLAFRMLPTTIPTPSEIGMAPILQKLIQRQNGLILFTGPTGSGKTTSVSTLIQWINQTSPVRILTLEDPLEYLYPNARAMVEQREIGVDTTSFYQGIYASLRQDPDLIMIGELRELEAMEAALRAADAGKLVFATMHASRAMQAIHRYIGSFPDERQNWIRSQLADVLLVIVNQRLIQSVDQQAPVLVQEVLVGTPAVRHLIRSNQMSQIPSIMETGQAEGMQTLEMAMNQAVRTGRLKKQVDSMFELGAGR